MARDTIRSIFSKSGKFGIILDAFYMINIFLFDIIVNCIN